MTKTLDDYVNENSKFITLDDGESFEGQYQGFKIGMNSFGNETVYYSFKLKDSNAIQQLQTGSVKLARKMKKYKEGDFLKITRKGKDKKTTYEVEEGVPF